MWCTWLSFLQGAVVDDGGDGDGGLGFCSIASWRFGLVLFPVSNSSGVFCLLHDFSGGLCGGGVQGLVVLVDCVDHQLGVLCGGFGIDVVFFAASLCIDIGFLCELLFIDGAHIVSGVADLVTYGMAAGGQGIVLSLPKWFRWSCYRLRLLCEVCLTNPWGRVGCFSHLFRWFASPSGFLLFGVPGSLSETLDTLDPAM